MPTRSDSRLRLNAGGGSSQPAASGEYIKVVETECETDGFVNEQWVEPAVPGPVPWKTIVIILLLFIGGIVSTIWKQFIFKVYSYPDCLSI